MRKTNEELEAMIAEQESLISESAEGVDVQRGHVSKSLGQLIRNRSEAVKLLESRKEVTTVKLRSGI
ncbi:MAG: hypothetical protein JXB48_11965 [Candidatus Latescibacteria bacterium]|nr:hypothetical protein [Candidatus Latescibacterota bacterium]